MNKLDPFDGDEDGSDQEAPPPVPPTTVVEVSQMEAPQKVCI